MAHFTDQDREDLEDIFRIHYFSKVTKVDETIALAQAAGQTPAELFDDLYHLFSIKKLPQREAVGRRLRTAAPNATDADVESVIRQSEMRGLDEMDAMHLLQRRYSAHRLGAHSVAASLKSFSSPQSNFPEEQSGAVLTGSSLLHHNVNDSDTTNSKQSGGTGAVWNDAPQSPLVSARPPSVFSVVPSREATDDIIAEEVREWLAIMLGNTYKVGLLSMPNFIDALRSGVLLHVLLQKMENPPVADNDLRLPKRTSGFFVRDNVETFLREAKRRYNLLDGQLFTASDLVDGKGDRQVVTCLLTMARIAHRSGAIQVAPRTILYEHENEQMKRRDVAQLDLSSLLRGGASDREIIEGSQSDFHHPEESPTQESLVVSVNALSSKKRDVSEMGIDEDVVDTDFNREVIAARDDSGSSTSEVEIVIPACPIVPPATSALKPNASSDPRRSGAVSRPAQQRTSVRRASDLAKKKNDSHSAKDSCEEKPKKGHGSVEGGARSVYDRDTESASLKSRAEKNNASSQHPPQVSEKRIVWKHPGRSLSSATPLY